MWIRRKENFRYNTTDVKWKSISHHKWRELDAFTQSMYEVKSHPKPTPKQREALTRGQILRYLMAAEAQLTLARRAMHDMRDSNCPDSMMMFTDPDLDEAFQYAQLGRNRVNQAINKMRMSGVNRYMKPKAPVTPQGD